MEGELSEIGSWDTSDHWVHDVAKGLEGRLVVGSMGLDGSTWSLWAGPPDEQVLMSRSVAGFAFDPNDPTTIAWLDGGSTPTNLIIRELEPSRDAATPPLPLAGSERLVGWTDAGIAVAGKEGSSILTPAGEIVRLNLPLTAWSDEGTGIGIVTGSALFVDSAFTTRQLDLPELDDEALPLSASWLPNRRRFALTSFVTSPEGTIGTLRLVTADGEADTSITFEGWKVGYATEWGDWLAISGGSGTDNGEWLRLWNPADDTVISVLSTEQIAPIAQISGPAPLRPWQRMT